MSPVHVALVDQLAQGRWFAALPADLQQAIVAASSVRVVRRGETITREGEPVAALCAVLAGQLRLVKRVEGWGESVFHVAGPGAWVGWTAMRPGTPAFATTVATDRTRVLMLPGPAFERLIAEDPSRFRLFADLLFEYMGAVLRLACGLPGMHVDAQLRRRLVELVDRARWERRVEEPVALAVSQSDLASMLGVSRQRVNERLQALQREGLIELAFRRIVVVDEPRLRASADPGASATPWRDGGATGTAAAGTASRLR